MASHALVPNIEKVDFFISNVECPMLKLQAAADLVLLECIAETFSNRLSILFYF